MISVEILRSIPQTLLDKKESTFPEELNKASKGVLVDKCNAWGKNIQNGPNTTKKMLIDHVVQHLDHLSGVPRRA